MKKIFRSKTFYGREKKSRDEKNDARRRSVVFDSKFSLEHNAEKIGKNGLNAKDVPVKTTTGKPSVSDRQQQTLKRRSLYDDKKNDVPEYRRLNVFEEFSPTNHQIQTKLRKSWSYDNITKPLQENNLFKKQQMKHFGSDSTVGFCDIDPNVEIRGHGNPRGFGGMVRKSLKMIGGRNKEKNLRKSRSLGDWNECKELLSQSNPDQAPKLDRPIPVDSPEIRRHNFPPVERKTQSYSPHVQNIIPVETIKIGREDQWKFVGTNLVIDSQNKTVGLVKSISKDEKNLEITVTRFSGGQIKLQFENAKKLHKFKEDFDKLDSQKSFFSKFFKRRVSREVLESKGILKNEAVFGQNLDQIYQEIGDVPRFIYELIKIIEEEHNLRTQGLYRTSGNLASIQKIRLDVDQNRLEVLNSFRKDIDVLTGTLKLFFRELKEPLLSTKVVIKIVNIMDKNDCQDSLRPVLHDLTKAHRHALYILLRHLIKVLQYTEDNKMDSYNLAVCWAPAIIFNNDVQSQDMVTKFAEAVKVFEFILNYYNQNQEVLRFLEVEKPKIVRQNSIDEMHHNNVHNIVVFLEENLEDGIYFKGGNTAKVEKIMKVLRKSKIYAPSKNDSRIDLANVLRKYLKELNIIGEDVVRFYNDKKNLSTQQEILDRIPKKKILILVLNHMKEVMEKVRNIDKEKFIDLMSKNLTDKSETECVALVKFLLSNNQPDIVRDLERNASYRNKQELREITKSVYDNVDTRL